MEMASGHYVTALTSLMDTEEGFGRLEQALCEIDRELEERDRNQRKNAQHSEKPKAAARKSCFIVACILNCYLFHFV